MYCLKITVYADYDVATFEEAVAKATREIKVFSNDVQLDSEQIEIREV